MDASVVILSASLRVIWLCVSSSVIRVSNAWNLNMILLAFDVGRILLGHFKLLIDSRILFSGFFSKSVLESLLLSSWGTTTTRTFFLLVRFWDRNSALFKVHWIWVTCCFRSFCMALRDSLKIILVQRVCLALEIRNNFTHSSPPPGIIAFPSIALPQLLIPLRLWCEFVIVNLRRSWFKSFSKSSTTFCLGTWSRHRNLLYRFELFLPRLSWTLAHANLISCHGSQLIDVLIVGLSAWANLVLCASALVLAFVLSVGASWRMVWSVLLSH
jgi:hypothetical protein